MEDYLASYLGIVVVLFLTGCGLPLPEEVPIVAAGIAASLGKLDPVMGYAACMVGALAGDTAMYSIGRVFGRRLFRRHGWFARIVNEQTEARAERMIRRHGLKVFFLARFLVGIRGPMYIALGVLALPLPRFLLIDAISAAVVVGLGYWLSYFFGKSFKRFLEDAHDVQVAVTVTVLVLLVAAGLIWWWRYHRRKMAELESEDEDTTDKPATPGKSAEPKHSTPEES